jgi:hypothetical protein
MSSPNEKSFIDRYWQVFVILFGIVFALILATWTPAR